MQAIRTMLPEFPGCRNESEAAPRRRARHRPSVELLIQPFDPLVELLPRSERFALARHDRTELSVALPRREVLIRLLRGDVLDSPLYPNLTAEWPPMEEKRGLRVRLELAALPGRVMRVEDEPALAEMLHEHHPHRRRSARTRRRERHRLRHLERRARLGEPPPELLERVGGEIGAPELRLSLSQSFARNSAGRRVFPPSSPSVGTRSRTTRSTTSASSLSGLRILFPLSR